jgi:hypothetical protein
MTCVYIHTPPINELEVLTRYKHYVLTSPVSDLENAFLVLIVWTKVHIHIYIQTYNQSINQSHTCTHTHTQIPETCAEFDLGPPARGGVIKEDLEWLEEWTQVCTSVHCTAVYCSA